MILLIRHAPHADVGHVLSGRTPGLALTDAGIAQAQHLAQRLAEEPIDRVEASPLERTVQTAQAIADARGVAVRQNDALVEIDFGRWTGHSFAALDGDDE